MAGGLRHGPFLSFLSFLFLCPCVAFMLRMVRDIWVAAAPTQGLKGG